METVEQLPNWDLRVFVLWVFFFFFRKFDREEFENAVATGIAGRRRRFQTMKRMIEDGQNKRARGLSAALSGGHVYVMFWAHWIGPIRCNVS